jgi:hypothetical protein
MDPKETTETTQTTQTTETAAPPAGQAGEAGAQTTQTTPGSAATVVPEGYVKAEDVETERTARTAAEQALSEAIAERDRIAGEARAERITSIATRLGFNDPKDAEKFMSADEQDIEGALKTVLEQKSYLAKPAEAEKPAVTPTSPTNPSRGAAQLPTFTNAQISDRAFWNQNKEAIMLAMREGRITG